MQTVSKFWRFLSNLPIRVKIILGIVATGIISFFAIFLRDFPILHRLPDWVRLAIIIFLFTNFTWNLIGFWDRGRKVEKLTRRIGELAIQLQSTETELSQLQKEKDAILDIDESIWKRPDHGTNDFRPLSERKTPCISVVNLKGGVGKTTLTANLGACLATMSQPLRVLVVDLDFQGTLSDMCVEQPTLALLKQTKNTASALLAENASAVLLETLPVGMTKVSTAKIICAHDRLDTFDFRLQAQFLLDPQREVRFCLQKVFHDIQKVNSLFDIVLFDCPPRLTTSSVNALTCSDYVLIPTKLDQSSITAVPRTLKWIEAMGKTVCAKPIGIVANETITRGDKLISKHHNAYRHLAETLLPRQYGDIMFKHTVGFSNRIAHTTHQGVVASTDVEAKRHFINVAEELRARIGI